LRDEKVGSLGPVPLVVLDHVVAEGGLRPVKCHPDATRIHIPHQVDQHGGEPVDGVRHHARPRGQVDGQSEEGPEYERVTVEEKQGPVVGHR